MRQVSAWTIGLTAASLLVPAAFADHWKSDFAECMARPSELVQWRGAEPTVWRSELVARCGKPTSSNVLGHMEYVYYYGLQEQLTFVLNRGEASAPLARGRVVKYERRYHTLSEGALDRMHHAPSIDAGAMDVSVDESLSSAAVSMEVTGGVWHQGERVVSGRNTNYREGETPNEYVYRYYPDGSGSVRRLGEEEFTRDRWSLNCTQDAMTDIRACAIHRGTGGPYITALEGADPDRVCIFGHDFPGRRGMIRVDRNPPIETDESGCVPAAAFFSQVTPDSVVIMRSYRWPRDYPTDTETSLDGLEEALGLARHIVDNIDGLSFEP